MPLDAYQSCPGSGPRCVHGQAGPERGEMGACCPYRLQKGDPWAGGANYRKPPQAPELTGSWHRVLRLERGPRGAGRAMALAWHSAFSPCHLTASACGWRSRAAGKCSWPPWAPQQSLRGSSPSHLELPPPPWLGDSTAGLCLGVLWGSVLTPALLSCCPVSWGREPGASHSEALAGRRQGLVWQCGLSVQGE